jgi:hypothetical protein
VYDGNGKMLKKTVVDGQHVASVRPNGQGGHGDWAASPPTDMLANHTMESTAWNGTAGEVRDATLNGVHGSSVGGVTTANASSAIAGDPGTCRYATGFDGTSSYLYVGSPQFALTNQVTVMAWVRWGIAPASGDTWATIVSNNSQWAADYGQFWLQHSQDNSKFEFAVNTSAGHSYVQSSAAPQQGQWQHVAGVYNGTTLTIYVNGVASGTASLSGNVISPQDEFNLRIGRWGWDTAPRSFNGDIDEVRIYPRSLSGGEVASAMAATHPCGASEPGAAHYLEECERALRRLFHDPHSSVRGEAAACFREFSGSELDAFADLIDAFAESPAFAEHHYELLRALDETTAYMPQTIRGVCERFVEVVGAEAGDIRTATSAHADIVCRLTLRAHSTTHDGDLQRRSLNVIDKMMKYNYYGLAQAIGAYSE